MASLTFDRRRSRSGAGSAGRVAGLILLGLLLGRARPAGAAEARATGGENQETRAAARTRLVEGVELLRQRQYAEALRKFDEAYALVPSPNVHYNRGLAYRGLGQNAAAVEAFDGFIATATNPPAGTREQAQRYLDELRARVARVAITSELPGADLLIDGRAQGFATAGRIVYLDPGSHELLARRRDGGASARAQVTAAAGQELAVTLRIGAPPLATAPAPATARAPAAPPPAPSGARPDRGQTADAPTPEATPAAHAEAATGSAWTAAPRWALIAAGSGVLLLGAGVTLELLARREGRRLSDDSGAGIDGHPVLFDVSKENNGLRYQTLGYIGLGVGAAALVAGISGYVVARRPIAGSERAARGQPRGLRSLMGGPLLGPRLAGARVELSF